MTLDQIYSLSMDDINRLSKNELQSILKKEKAVLMRRYKRQKASGEIAPVFKGSNNPYRLKTTNMTRQQMMAQFTKMTQLTKAKTTTVSGFKKWKSKQNKLFSKTELTEKQRKKLWNMYDRIQQVHPALTSIIDYKKIIKTISNIVEGKKRISFDMVDKAVKKLAESESETSSYYAEEEWDNLL